MPMQDVLEPAQTTVQIPPLEPFEVIHQIDAQAGVDALCAAHDLLCHALAEAQFTDLGYLDECPPVALARDRNGAPHAIHMLILPHDFFDVDLAGAQKIVDMFVDHSVSEPSEFVSDVAVMVFDETCSRCRIHHVKDVLHKPGYVQDGFEHFVLTPEGERTDVAGDGNYQW